MIIKKLRLEGYKRLMLAGTQTLEINPQSEMQLLIGSNGSGKSSVLEELSPLPGNHKHFIAGGLKEVHIEHEGILYKFINEYIRGTGKHTIIRGSDIIHDQGTITIQREWVENLFGYTHEIHEILTGQTNFTSMPATKRREWLTRMTPMSLDYVFKVYNTKRMMVRDNKGVIKHLNARLTKETETQEGVPLDQKALQKAYDEKEKILKDLYINRNPSHQSPYIDVETYGNTFRSAVEDARAFLKRYPKLDSINEINSSESLTEALRDIGERIASLKDKHEFLLGEIEKLPTVDVEFQKEDLNTLIDEWEKINIELNQAPLEKWKSPENVFPVFSIHSLNQPKAVLEEYRSSMLSLIHSIPENKEGYYSKERGQKAKDKLKEYQDQYRGIENQALNTSKKIQHIESCEKVTCPQCDHGFIPGVSKSTLGDLKEQLTVLKGQLLEMDSRIKNVEKYIGDLDNYLDFVKQFGSITRDYPAMKPINQVWVDQKLMFRSPAESLEAFQTWFDQMCEYEDYNEKLEYYERLCKRVKLTKEMQEAGLGSVTERKNELEEQLQQTQNSMRAALTRQEALTKFKTQIESTLITHQEKSTELQNLIDAYPIQLEALFQKVLDNEIGTAQLSMAELRNSLSKLQVKESILQDIQTEREKVLTTQKELSILLDALSPTDGLIGEYILRFMEHVVEVTNSVISEVWTYPLVMLPSEMEKDELTYRFPMDVQDGAVMVPDIALGSSSQKEIVNFAIRLLIMKSLNLMDVPLYLDEFGSTFDEQHRENLIRYLNRMIELNQVRQIFFISHFHSMHGAFNNADICVLDPTNIAVPESYNEHVVIA